MSNNYFQFKQFTIHQEHCAMKVSTEACILGAWVPDEKPERILDIGTGTGLLSLMLAQRMEAPVDAVELDLDAAKQAAENVKESPWSKDITVIREDIFSFTRQTDQTYDLIISNPPFFSNSLKSDIAQLNLAKHDTSDFSKTHLAEALKVLLSKNGTAYILYPEFETKQFCEEVLKTGLHCAPALIIRNQPNRPVFRIVSIVSKQASPTNISELNIREGKVHSARFNELLKPYYLKL